MFNEFIDFLRRPDPPPVVHASARQGLPERNDMERTYARLFSSDDGRLVLGHLQAMTFQRALGPECADAQLRHLEGQRVLVASIMRMIDRGKKG